MAIRIKLTWVYAESLLDTGPRGYIAPKITPSSPDWTTRCFVLVSDRQSQALLKSVQLPKYHIQAITHPKETPSTITVLIN